jgi:hypothetical protein
MQRLPGGHGAPPPRGRHSSPPPRSHRAPKPPRGGPHQREPGAQDAREYGGPDAGEYGRPDGQDARRLRLAGLTVAVVVALGLPLVASAVPIGDADDTARRASHTSRTSERADVGGAAERDGADGKTNDGGDAEDPARSHLLLGLGLATATRCGPELTSPDGIEAQTCVLTQGDETWARAYYRNATGRELRSVLSMMGPGGRTVRMHCVVGAEDEPGACETPRERTRGEMGAYTAVAEFAAPDGSGPLLLRSGSNSGPS